MNKRILFINPPQNIHNTKSIPMYPSGALVLMATMCQNEGYDVKIYDGAVDNTDLRNIIGNFRPTHACITCNTFQTKYANKYLDIIKKTDKRIITIIGGPHPSAIGKQTLVDFPNATFAVMGEGEFTVLNLINDIIPISEINGICYKNPLGIIIKTPPLSPTTNLDHIPLPNLDLVNLEKYSGINSNSNERSMFIMASRGCPFDCTYCNKSIFGKSVRFRKPQKIIEEIKWLHEKYGINHIYFQDDTFNLKREWINEILHLIIANGLNKNIKYMAPFRVNDNLVDMNLLSRAKVANFETIFYGVESGNQEMLDRMHKGIRVEEVIRAFSLTHLVGINTVAAFIIGLPGETRETIKDTLNLWREINPTYSGFSMATPFPNTKFEQEIKSNGQLLNSNYNEYRCGGSYVRTEELTRYELDFYNSIAILGQGHEWIYKFPIFAIGKNPFLRAFSVGGINAYRKYRSWRGGL